MRRAEWRQRADDPKTPLGWWWRGIVEGDRFMGLQLFSLLLSMGLWFMGTPWAFMPMGVVFSLCALARRKKPPARLKELLPEPAPGDQFRAFVAYRRNGQTTGTDFVALTFVGGWLHAEGVRSGFSLRAQDVQRPASGSGRTDCLILPDGGEVQLNGLDDAGRSSLILWLGVGERVPGLPTLPPSAVHPAQFARWVAYLVAGLAVEVASAWFQGGGEGGWIRVVLHQGLTFCGYMLISFACYRLWRLMEMKISWETEEPAASLPSLHEVEEAEEARIEAGRIRPR